MAMQREALVATDGMAGSVLVPYTARVARRQAEGRETSWRLVMANGSTGHPWMPPLTEGGQHVLTIG